MKQLLGMIAFCALLVSCSKTAGDGGAATISGKVDVEVRDILFVSQSTVYTAPAYDHDVYIIYGDDTSPSDRVRTNFDGEYSFENLRKGDYTIYVYSRDTTAEAVAGTAPRDFAIAKEVSIADRKQEKNDIDFLIYDEN